MKWKTMKNETESGTIQGTIEINVSQITYGHGFLLGNIKDFTRGTPMSAIKGSLISLMLTIAQTP